MSGAAAYNRHQISQISATVTAFYCLVRVAVGAAMTAAEQIVIGVASLIALIGWVRWVGVYGEMRKQHPTGPPKYQRPSNGQNSETLTIRHASSQREKVLQVLSPDEGIGITPPDPDWVISPVPRTPKLSPTSSPKRRWKLY